MPRPPKGGRDVSRQICVSYPIVCMCRCVMKTQVWKMGDYSWAGSDDKKDDVKLLGFETAEEWYQAATMLQMYSAQTSPPLMDVVAQNQHVSRNGPPRGDCGCGAD